MNKATMNEITMEFVNIDIDNYQQIKEFIDRYGKISIDNTFRTFKEEHDQFSIIVCNLHNRKLLTPEEMVNMIFLIRLKIEYVNNLPRLDKELAPALQQLYNNLLSNVLAGAKIGYDKKSKKYYYTEYTVLVG